MGPERDTLASDGLWGLFSSDYFLFVSTPPSNDLSIQDNLFLSISCVDNTEHSAFEDAALISQDFRRLIFCWV